MPLFLAANCFFPHTLEANLWEERKKSLQIARIPNTVYPNSPNNLPDPTPAAFNLAKSRKIQKWAPKRRNKKLESVLRGIPEQFSTIRKVTAPSNSEKIVIHIQDVHMNLEAQRNIGATIQELVKQGAVDVIGLEAAFEEIDVSAWREFGRQDITKKVADYLLKENKITGPIYASLLSPVEWPSIVGIDHKKLYDLNVEAYRNSSKLISHNNEVIQNQIHDLEKQKLRTFNSDLLSFDKVVEAYQNDHISIGDYVKFLAQTSNQLSEEMKLFLRTLNLENSLDFEKAEKERSQLVTKLLRNLNEEKTSAFIQQSIDFRLKKASHAYFYQYLNDLCQESDVKLDRFPSIKSYIEYTFLSDSISADKLLNDIHKTKSHVYDSLAKTNEEQALIKKSYSAFLTQKLLDFSLTPKEWDLYKKDSAENKISQIQRIDEFESFYHQAENRDRAISKNILTAMSDKKESISILVTGGFHSEGIESQLTMNKVTVITLAPRITKIEDKGKTSYLSVFTQQKAPLDELFEGKKLFLGIHPLLGLNEGAVAAATLSHPAELQSTLNQLSEMEPLQIEKTAPQSAILTNPLTNKKLKVRVHETAKSIKKVTFQNLRDSSLKALIILSFGINIGYSVHILFQASLWISILVALASIILTSYRNKKAVFSEIFSSLSFNTFINNHNFKNAYAKRRAAVVNIVIWILALAGGLYNSNQIFSFGFILTTLILQIGLHGIYLALNSAGSQLSKLFDRIQSTVDTPFLKGLLSSTSYMLQSVPLTLPASVEIPYSGGTIEWKLNEQATKVPDFIRQLHSSNAPDHLALVQSLRGSEYDPGRATHDNDYDLHSIHRDKTIFMANHFQQKWIKEIPIISLRSIIWIWRNAFDPKVTLTRADRLLLTFFVLYFFERLGEDPISDESTNATLHGLEGIDRAELYAYLLLETVVIDHEIRQQQENDKNRDTLRQQRIAIQSMYRVTIRNLERHVISEEDARTYIEPRLFSVAGSHSKLNPVLEDLYKNFDLYSSESLQSFFDRENEKYWLTLFREAKDLSPPRLDPGHIARQKQKEEEDYEKQLLRLKDLIDPYEIKNSFSSRDLIETQQAALGTPAKYFAGTDKDIFVLDGDFNDIDLGKETLPNSYQFQISLFDEMGKAGRTQWVLLEPEKEITDPIISWKRTYGSRPSKGELYGQIQKYFNQKDPEAIRTILGIPSESDSPLHINNLIRFLHGIHKKKEETNSTVTFIFSDYNDGDLTQFTDKDARNVLIRGQKEKVEKKVEEFYKRGHAVYHTYASHLKPPNMSFEFEVLRFMATQLGVKYGFGENRTLAIPYHLQLSIWINDTHRTIQYGEGTHGHTMEDFYYSFYPSPPRFITRYEDFIFTDDNHHGENGHRTKPASPERSKSPKTPRPVPSYHGFPAFLIGLSLVSPASLFTMIVPFVAAMMLLGRVSQYFYYYEYAPKEEHGFNQKMATQLDHILFGPIGPMGIGHRVTGEGPNPISKPNREKVRRVFQLRNKLAKGIPFPQAVRQVYRIDFADDSLTFLSSRKTIGEKELENLNKLAGSRGHVFVVAPTPETYQLINGYRDIYTRLIPIDGFSGSFPILENKDIGVETANRLDAHLMSHPDYRKIGKLNVFISEDLNGLVWQNSVEALANPSSPLKTSSLARQLEELLSLLSKLARPTAIGSRSWIDAFRASASAA